MQTWNATSADRPSDDAAISLPTDLSESETVTVAVFVSDGAAKGRRPTLLVPMSPALELLDDEAPRGLSDVPVTLGLLLRNGGATLLITLTIRNRPNATQSALTGRRSTADLAG